VSVIDQTRPRKKQTVLRVGFLGMEARIKEHDTGADKEIPA